MVYNKQQFIIDILVLVAIAAAVYYLRMQTGEGISPADGIMSLIGVN